MVATNNGSSYIYETREQWLGACMSDLVPQILSPVHLDLSAETGEPITNQVRVSCGWPSARGLSRVKRSYGQTWPVSASADGHSEIFISPKVADSMHAAGVLLQNLLHVAVGPAIKNGKAYQEACSAVGLYGKPTDPEVSDKLEEQLIGIIANLGDYPHAELDQSVMPKQSTRQLKAHCQNDACPSAAEGGYVMRLTAKWAQFQTPVCPCCDEEMHVEGLKSPASVE